MNTKTVGMIIAMIASLGMIVSTSFIDSVNAKASDKANEVAHAANTNVGYIKAYKEFNSAHECATGPGNNGDFTSHAAHLVNGP